METTQLQQWFRVRYGNAPQTICRAPGRIEVLGNHTDYNQGTTLSAAVDRYIWIALSPVAGRECIVWDQDLQQERRFSLDALQQKQNGDWCNYVKGVVVAMMAKGLQVPAFQAVVAGDVPISAGMSSSAAFEMSVVTALDQVMGSRLDWLTKAKLGQACENEYIGAHTGLLDQFSSLCGKAGCLVFSDFRSFETAVVPMPAGARFVVVNSMVKHVLTGEYNERRQCCEEAVRILQVSRTGIQSLRDVSRQELAEKRKLLPEVVFSRASHVVGEMGRVADGILALKAGRLKDFGKLLWESHESSRCSFQNSCVELDFLVAQSKEIPGCLGARLSGGGFGGISIHLVEEAQAEAYAAAIAAAYEKEYGRKPQTFLCQAADGACVMA